MDFSRLKYISTDAPSTDELELLNESRIRVAQIIRARWIILGILAAYGVVPSTTETLVKAADDAMYVSKRTQKDKVVVAESAPSLIPIPVNDAGYAADKPLNITAPLTPGLQA